jgi:hypothetical protein
VGHDGFISYVVLDDVLAGDGFTPKLLNVSTNVFDVVLDGRGFARVSESVRWSTSTP